MQLLLLSNSTNAGEDFLRYPVPHIADFLGSEPRTIAFIPYAAVRFGFDHYTELVRERFAELGHEVISVHEVAKPVDLIKSADGIVVGGGNTFCLLKRCYDHGLVEQMREAVLRGTPYIGWSAGSNLACPTIRTTNDMPIVEPPSFKALGFVPFQLNPHFTTEQVPGLRGETREERIEEFIAMNPEVSVIGLREGTMLKLASEKLTLIGPHTAKVFSSISATREVPAGDVSFLLDTQPVLT